MEFAASIGIEAPPERVWTVLTDLPGWPSWDSAVVRTEGRIAPGARIRLWSTVAPERAFRLRVTGHEPNEHLTFEGGMPLGLFRGVRDYDLAPRPEGGTSFRMREVYSGPLLPLIGRSIPDLQPSFETFARGLKERAESASRG